MQSSDVPSRVLKPFAAGGGRSPIPLASQIGIADGAASLTDGFPPLTRTPPAAGGIPPSGLEMNGILYLISAGLWWQQAGGMPRYDSAFATATGGYPSGSVLQSADGAGFWRSTVENNLTNPDTGGAGWVPQQGYGQTATSLAGANVTLTAAQAMRPQIVLTGTLSANINLIFPAAQREWLVENSTTGAYAITAKTASGTGVVLNSGPNLLYGDGANVKSQLSNRAGATQALGAAGFLVHPGGLIERWGRVVVGNAPTGITAVDVTFAEVFPTEALFVSLTVQDQSSANNLIVSYKNLNASGFTLSYGETSSAVQDATIHWIAKGY